MAVTRVLLADDHQLFREGLGNILNGQPDFEVVGEAGDGLEVFVMARELEPDLILMDVGMPGCNGVEATQRIKEAMPDIIIVMLTVRDEDDNLFEAIKSGAQGYLLKSIRSWDLVEMLRAAVRGEAAITPALGGKMLEEFRKLSRQTRRDTGNDVALTGREQEVLSLVSQGHTDQEISDTLHISIHTVKTHMRNILGKLQVGHRHEAALYAMREGLIPRGPARGNT